MNADKIANIQVLRAIAAIGVVMGHSLGAADAYHPAAHYLWALRMFGASGVVIFFVISGFLMVYIQQQHPRTPLQFFSARFIRIAPTYYILTLALFALWIAAPPSVFNTIHMDRTRLVASLAFADNLRDGGPIVGVGWTLEVEMLFYAIFALSLLFGSQTSFLFRCIMVLLVTALAPSAYPIGLGIQFIAGMGCAWIYMRHPISRSGWPCVIVGWAMIALANSPWEPRSLDLLLHYGSAPFVLLGALYLPQTSNRLVLYLGAASYSIYLAQVFSITAFYKVASRHFTEANGDVICIACVVASVALGVLVYEQIERRCAFIIRKCSLPRTAFATAS